MSAIPTNKHSEIKANTIGVNLVRKPEGRIYTQIIDNPKFAPIKDKLINTFQTVVAQYKSHPMGALLRYSGEELTLEKLAVSYNASIQMGQASEGLCPFAVSSVLSQIARESSDKVALLTINGEGKVDKQAIAAFTTPLMVDSSEEALQKFRQELNTLFATIGDSAPGVTFVPCRFDHNGRSHWILIAIEKQESQTIVTYINTRGGNHESMEPAERTLAAQENVLEQATKAHFSTSLVRNPDTPICLTVTSCGFDIIDIAERLTEQVSAGNSVSEFVAAGGLLQIDDLATTNPEQADLNNRARCAERFIDFLSSWE